MTWRPSVEISNTSEGVGSWPSRQPVKAGRKISLKRAYEPASPGDGYRVLVDRLWPRGVSKQDLPLDLWDKDIAPTPGLRQWFGHDPGKWSEFRRQYRRELSSAAQKARLRDLLASAGSRPLTLIYGAKDSLHNHAIVLREMLTNARKYPRPESRPSQTRRLSRGPSPRSP
jgi:uncharacterized protein YeaO (DUF488 family)